MITQIQKIVNIGCYDCFTFDKSTLKPFNKINILYGSNGSGKTTLSNLFYLLSKNCKDKELLLNELLDDSSELEVITTHGKITRKTITSKELDIYVFNSKFISDHVYDGVTTNVDAFSSDIKISSPEIECIDGKLLILNGRLHKVRNWLQQIEVKLETIFKTLNVEFGKKVSNSRLTNVKPSINVLSDGDILKLEKELAELYKKYEAKSQESLSIEKLFALKEKLELITFIDIDGLADKLRNPVSTEAKGKIVKRIHTYQERIKEKGLEEQIGDLNDWFKKGGRLLHISKDIDSSCPLCDQQLTNNIDTIIGEYSAYFTNSLLSLYEVLDKYINFTNDFQSNEQFKRNNTLAEDINLRCVNDFGIMVKPVNYDKETKLNEAIANLSQALKEKKQTPESIIEIQDSYWTSLIEYNRSIEKFKNDVIEKLELEIAKIQSESLQEIILKIKDKISTICSVKLNLKENNIFLSSSKSNSNIANAIHRLNSALISDIKGFEEKKIIEVSKLNSESRFINFYLKHFGITNFHIQRLDGRNKDNIVINYQTSGRKKTKLNCSLSEGEKTALAFAYFISKLRVEKLEGNVNGFKDCIIVIDDPISSLDDNRLFQTANLIDSFLFYNKSNTEFLDHHPCQLFIFSHNLTFLKYIHNAFRANFTNNAIGEYYLSTNSPKFKNLPSSLKNFTNTYILKLKTVIDFKERMSNYDDVKNYLPNYIRIVLETFLAFKLALVKEGKEERLPGLQHLINAMIREFDSIDDVTIGDINKSGAIERLNHLKKIADHESHGNIYKAEEFSFISEHELKTFAKNTIQVISYIDNLHFKKIKNHSV